MTDLERRAEELVKWLLHFGGDYQRDAANAVEQLLSENRQVRERKSRTNDTKSHVELDLPNSRLRDAVLGWLSSNEKAGPDVRWGAYPHGMVQRWIERAEKAEARVKELQEAHQTAWAERNAARDEVTSLRQDLDRISAEREAYREARSFCSWLVSMDEPDSSARRTVTLTQIIAEARRILAENDR